MTYQLSVAVVDDDEAVRDSIRWMLEGQRFKVHAFSSAEAFLALWQPGSTGCVILDIRMPGMTGIELHDELLKRGYNHPIIFITGHADVQMAVLRMKQGAIDFLEKPFNHQQLFSLVTNALEASSARFETDKTDLQRKEKLARLTGREQQVLERIVAGRLNKQIADDLTISIKTVEAHRANIMEKLEARTMAELMKIAMSESANIGHIR